MSSPARLGFGESPRSTVGLEWEIGLIRSDTADLSQSGPEVLEALARAAVEPPDGSASYVPHVAGEFMENTIELVTGVCRTVSDAGFSRSRW